MLLITFATDQEAKPTIDALQATFSEKHNSFLFEQGSILITGMGSLSSSCQTLLHLQRHREIWNFGLAGSLQERCIGSILPIQSVSKWLHFPEDLDTHSQIFGKKIHPPLFLQEEGARLISSDYPLHHPKIKEHLKKEFDLVDMEGFGVAFAASLLKKPCKSWKIISDFASTNGQDLIKKHIAELSLKMSSFIQSMVASKFSK